MSTVWLKRGDTAVQFTDTLQINGSAVNLTGAAVRFCLRGGTKAIKSAASVVSALAGTVSYDVASTDVDTAGYFKQEWEVTFADGKVLTFPNQDYNAVEIQGDLG